LLYMSI